MINIEITDVRTEAPVESTGVSTTSEQNYTSDEINYSSNERVVDASDVVFFDNTRTADLQFRPLENYKITDLAQDLINRDETWFDRPPQLWDLNDGTYLVCDGRHRVAAYAELGVNKFPAIIHQGDTILANTLIHRVNSMPGWKYDGKEIAQILWQFILIDYDSKSKTMKKGKGKGEEYAFKAKELSRILGISESTVEKRRRVLRNYVEDGKEPPKLWWKAAQRQEADALGSDTSAEEYAEQFRELISINERCRIQSNNPLACNRSQWAEAALSQCSEDDAKRIILKYFRIGDEGVAANKKTKFPTSDASKRKDIACHPTNSLFDENYLS